MLIGVLLSLGVVSVLVLGWMRSGIARRDQARQAEQRLQADWLAESGLERAAARLAAKPDYKGEIWNIAAAELSGPRARVEIRVNDVAGREAARRVTVVADYPADPGAPLASDERIDLGTMNMPRRPMAPRPSNYAALADERHPTRSPWSNCWS